MVGYGNRREFLKNTVWAGLAATATGCAAERAGLAGPGGTMCGFAAAKLDRVRVGVVGLGMRGTSAVFRLSSIPGVEIAALADLYPERVAQSQRLLETNGWKPARGYSGREGWKALCESDLDVVYNTTPWNLHAPVALYAMEHGKHAMTEVPAATTLEECWALVETSERTRRHCMQLENCCYGEAEMLCLNLVRKGFFGDVLHGEGAYIHDLRKLCYADPVIVRDKETTSTGYAEHWRLRHNQAHRGNQYETHGLGPLCQCMDINRGDRFDCLVSLETRQASYEAYGRATFPAGDWRHGAKVRMGDINTTLIRTARGRTILVQHDVSTPRPTTRINRINGTKGEFVGSQMVNDPLQAFTQANAARFGWIPGTAGSVHAYFGFERTQKVRKEHMHPLWRDAGDAAVRLGGHGGMDLLMDLRWVYCLRRGLPLDTNVYDLASWCSLGELTERSAGADGEPLRIPDFTRGGWRDQRPLGIETVDLAWMGFDPAKVRRDANQLNV